MNEGPNISRTKARGNLVNLGPTYTNLNQSSGEYELSPITAYSVFKETVTLLKDE